VKGDIVDRGIEFKGGYYYQVYYEGELPSDLISQLQNEYPGIKIRKISGESLLSIEYNKDIPIKEILEEKGVKVKDVTKRMVSSSLSASFWRTAIKLLIIAYLLVTVVVFVTFRTFVPSLAIVLAGLSDIIIALVGMNLFDIPLTAASLTALLILIGYSVDTDILLTTRVIKEKPTDIDKALVSAAKTGLTMTATSLAGMFSLYFIGLAPVLRQIALVIIFGLLADVIFTWLQNASIIKLYMVRKNA
ncbi:MAG: hypothetical protein GXN99_00790, partial [Candidatus Nanohaloarchaeota archaeon]|nr:hypothetical protein [Candidatus Nanohaloarchaeota archaeon]